LSALERAATLGPPPLPKPRISGRPYVAEDLRSEGQMQAIIARWCDLIGVTNEGSIQVATGVVSGGAALFVAYAAFVIVGTILGYIGGVIRDISS
jgi:hypothetical protein